MEAGPISAREVLRRGSNQPPDRSTSAPHLARTSIAPQAISSTDSERCDGRWPGLHNFDSVRKLANKPVKSSEIQWFNTIHYICHICLYCVRARFQFAARASWNQTCHLMLRLLSPFKSFHRTSLIEPLISLLFIGSPWKGGAGNPRVTCQGIESTESLI